MNILPFKECSYQNKQLVGGKCSSLGELNSLSHHLNFNIADGFALTTLLYDKFIEQNNLHDDIEASLQQINYNSLKSIEDPFDEYDYEGWETFTKKMDNKIMIVGDDLFTTNIETVIKGIENKLFRWKYSCAFVFACYKFSQLLKIRFIKFFFQKVFPAGFYI